MFKPTFIENLLESSDSIDPTVWLSPTGPSISRNTLNLEFTVSIFKTLTLSVPIPKISLGTIFVADKLPDTEKNVTKPVTDVEPTAILFVVPIPTSLKVSLETPI